MVRASLASALVVIAAAIQVAAAPLVTKNEAIAIPLRYSATADSARYIVENGLARLRHFNGRGNIDSRSAAPASGSITNVDVSYLATVYIGGVGQSLIVDIGSGNIWCVECEPTKKGKPINQPFDISYASGSASGDEYVDSVEFAGLTVPNQEVGSVSSAPGFSGASGVFGLGPAGLTQGTVGGSGSTAVTPTFLDNLYSLGLIPVEELGISFRPEPGSSSNSDNGVLTLGGVDSSLFTGSLSYFPKVTKGMTAPYWSLAISNLAYGSTLYGATTCILDTGTTLIYVPSKAYDGFLNATGGTTDASSGLASFTKMPTQNFSVDVSTSSFPLTPSQYLVPRAQYANFGLSAGKYYSWISDGANSGVNCILGQKFIESYYVALDTTNSRIGLAPER